MVSKTITTELNSEQIAKIEILKENGISVGEAISYLFELQYSVKSRSSELLNSRIEYLKSQIKRRKNKRA